VSIESVVARVAALQSAFAPPPMPSVAQSPAAAGNSSFAGMLTNAMGPGAVGVASPTAPIAGASGTGAAIVAAAAGEVGQAEQPPGSNDSPRIAQYRSATAGAAGPGPWCAYFVSWACRQAGVPVGENGQGFGSVDALYAWAQRAGRAQPVGSGYTPRPGDLIVFNQHIGIVENVLPNGQIQTIEGNSSDRVSRRTHPRGDAIGFVTTG
jgi:CHAP domain-containing protein